LREDVLPSLGITQTEFAASLRVSRRTVSQILHERRPLSADMAIRLAHYLNTTPESWLNMQQALDVWELERKYAHVYERIHKVA
jgi:addiction module HigA family antidote